MDDSSIADDAGIDEACVQHVYRADSLDRWAGKVRHDVPALAAVLGLVEWIFIGHARKVVGADIARKSVLVIQHPDGPKVRSRLGKNQVPARAAILAAKHPSFSVDVEADFRAHEEDVILLAFVGLRRKLVPVRTFIRLQRGAGLDRTHTSLRRLSLRIGRARGQYANRSEDNCGAL